MHDAARVRLQIRAVLVVYRTEMARQRRWKARTGARDAVEEFSVGLRARSLQVLEDARAELDGNAPEHQDLIREIEEARREIIAGD
jgi:hypothetical protein